MLCSVEGQSRHRNTRILRARDACHQEIAERGISLEKKTVVLAVLRQLPVIPVTRDCRIGQVKSALTHDLRLRRNAASQHRARNEPDNLIRPDHIWRTSQISHDPGWRGTCARTERDSWGRCAVAPGWAFYFSRSGT